MTEVKRARDIRIGDVLPDGSTVYSANPGVCGFNILSKTPDGKKLRKQYAAETIIPGPDERHPSRFEEGHPWYRKNRYRRSE